MPTQLRNLFTHKENPMKFKFGWLAALACVLVLATSCDQTVTPDDPKVAPNAPTNVMATSVNETTVGLKWLKSLTGETPTGYIITITEAGATTGTTLPVSGGSTEAVNVSGLTEGTIYTFSVQAVNDTVKSAASPSVMWAPAKRQTGTFKLYSSKSTTNGSGLSLKNGTVLKIADGAQWEFCYDDKDGRPLVGSPGVSGYTLPSGEFLIVSMDTVASHYVRANSLDDVYGASALDFQAGFTENLVDLSSLADQTKGVVFTVRSRVNSTTVNFAKVLVKSNGTSFVNGTGADSYIEVEVSYQTVVNVPYAMMDRLVGGTHSNGSHISK